MSKVRKVVQKYESKINLANQSRKPKNNTWPLFPVTCKNCFLNSHDVIVKPMLCLQKLPLAHDLYNEYLSICLFQEQFSTAPTPAEREESSVSQEVNLSEVQAIGHDDNVRTLSLEEPTGAPPKVDIGVDAIP